ncbi:MAG: RNA polymerase sigma factor [Vicinamibacteraceae bacterium]|nr:RNA polymerase sigma factor [Vicinamibacteraceae bacterium]
MTAPSGRLSAELQRHIVERIAEGDPSGEHDLAAIFERRIRLMLAARLRDHDAALEVTQDTLLAVITALRKGQLRNAESLAAFVHGIARNLANNFLRTRQESPRFVEVTPELPLAAPAHDFEGQERLALVRKAMGRLDPTDRTILLRTLLEGLKPGEIARDLGVSSEVVRTRKSRALKKVIEHVERLSQIGIVRHSVVEEEG